MKGLSSLFLGFFGTFAFSWLGLTVIPNWQIGHLDPQMDEEGTDVYPMPKSGMAERGRRVYVGNGCFYCHTQQVRADYAGVDIYRKWGERRSAPRDYIFERPALLGKTRMGPDLSNIGKRAPAEAEGAPAPGASPAASPGASPAAAASPVPASPAPPATTGSPAPKAAPAASPAAAVGSPAASPSPAGSPGPALGPGLEAESDQPPAYSATWHHQHLYSPRSITLDSNMPAYRFLYEKRRISGEPSADALKLTGRHAPAAGWEIVPNYDAKCLVAYLMSLDQSHPLNELKAAASAPASAASPPPAPQAPPASPPPK